LPAGILQPGRTPGAGVVAAARLFHLDDFGAEVGQVLRAPGAGQHAEKVEDAKVGEGAGHDGQCCDGFE
jgi:hypothetical protein